MSQPKTIKTPTINETNRAYVRLFECFSSPAHWLAFLDTYQVECIEFDSNRNGDCAVRVVDPSSEDLAILGLEIPNHITYHTYAATARSFWNEHFLSDTHRRHRIFEVGAPEASQDDVHSR